MLILQYTVCVSKGNGLLAGATSLFNSIDGAG
jgi:hypothetical protein